MKTLDEVIKALEICIGYNCSDAEHDVCPYFGESDMGCIKEPEKDALHYLKAFQDAKDTLEREKDRYAEAIKNCERAENIYKQKQKAAEDALWICKEDKDDLTALRAYWAEQQANPPLSWDELRQMEDKPVWVEHKYYNIWLIVYEVYENTIVLDGNGFYTQYFSDDNDKEVRWQAYRKERK